MLPPPAMIIACPLPGGQAEFASAGQKDMRKSGLVYSTERKIANMLKKPLYKSM
jgi:hypothetical protein